jgi:hypothetical protein
VVSLMDALRRSIAEDKSAEPAAAARGKGKSKAKPDDLRKQPQFKFPIEGGRSKPAKEAAKAAAQPVAAAKPKARRKSA